VRGRSADGRAVVGGAPVVVVFGGGLKVRLKRVVVERGGRVVDGPLLRVVEDAVGVGLRRDVELVLVAALVRLSDGAPCSALEIPPEITAPSKMTTMAKSSCRPTGQSCKRCQQRAIRDANSLTTLFYGAPGKDSHGIRSPSASRPATSP
jgi:hypothetical protein